MITYFEVNNILKADLAKITDDLVKYLDLVADPGLRSALTAGANYYQVEVSTLSVATLWTADSKVIIDNCQNVEVLMRQAAHDVLDTVGYRNSGWKIYKNVHVFYGDDVLTINFSW